MLKVKTYRPTKTMDVVNAVKMIVLVWTFTSVCEASDDLCTYSSSCADVTGTVHEELTLTCSFSLNCTKEADQCCIKWYMFKDGRENGTVIHKNVYNQTCEQETIVTCDYKPSANMTAKFIFFFQTTCGTKETEFIVNITESGDKPITTDTVKKGEANLTTSEVTVTVTVGAIIGFIIIMLIIYKKYNPTTPCRLLKD
ncbi:hypothetical protein G5714_012297 [Onychostoma macrolepis]|uniref:Uncharacterized protein n=1 Tax=Onychostoma macrolepis TaxID=369639 RepID=A0A7J6CG77_9TELE|nr:hypothetical protein G5714_012297 [Onychostoma macrolepis]